MNRIDPTAQNRLIDMIARNSRRICIVPRTSATDERMNRDIGACLYQPGAAQHFFIMEMLGQDRIFDRAEEGRVDAHGEQRGEQQRDGDRMHADAAPDEAEADCADEHDQDFRRLDPADDDRLVALIGQLSR